MALKHWNLEANEEAGISKQLETHFEIVSTMTAISEEMAICMQKHYQNATGQRFEVREVAE